MLDRLKLIRELLTSRAYIVVTNRAFYTKIDFDDLTRIHARSFMEDMSIQLTKALKEL